MTYEEWVKSLNLPSGVGVSNSEAFQAGRESYEAEIKQIWLEQLPSAIVDVNTRMIKLAHPFNHCSDPEI